MPKVRVAGFGVSLDGFSAGTDQTLNDPLGKRGPEIFQWFFHTKTFRAMHGQEGGSLDVDDAFARRAMENFGAIILGRNMFGPVRGPWPDRDWKGWWGENPPYHTPVFVLTHHPRASLEMSGGTTFDFVTDGIHAALERAVKAAKGLDVRLGGGVATIQQYLRAGLIDEMHLAMSPVLLGSGECLLEGIDAPKLGYHCTEHVATPNATHFVIAKRT
jgi:dihydrofolate reductase